MNIINVYSRRANINVKVVKNKKRGLKFDETGRFFEKNKRLKVKKTFIFHFFRAATRYCNKQIISDLTTPQMTCVSIYNADELIFCALRGCYYIGFVVI